MDTKYKENGLQQTDLPKHTNKKCRELFGARFQDRWMDGWLDGWTDGRMDDRASIHCKRYCCVQTIMACNWNLTCLVLHSALHSTIWLCFEWLRWMLWTIVASSMNILQSVHQLCEVNAIIMNPCQLRKENKKKKSIKMETNILSIL